MKADKVYNVQYIDGYYTYAKNISQTKLSLFEAYGYVKRNGNNIIVTFIKEKFAHKQEETSLGLVIPNTALISKKDIANKNILSGFKTGMSVAITWRDIVIFDSGDLRNDCPIMYTEGILFKIERDHIVLRNPETVHTYPGSVRNHPMKKPTYYIIPTSFITDITIIKR